MLSAVGATGSPGTPRSLNKFQSVVQKQIRVGGGFLTAEVVIDKREQDPFPTGQFKCVALLNAWSARALALATVFCGLD